MRLLILLMTAATLLQACEMTDGTQPGPPRGGLASCHAVGLDGLVGRSVNLLPRHGEWSSLRVIYPGQAVTMDYYATRLNARVGPRGIIQSLYCG